jgi:DNA-binding transcriptional MerR regulator
LAKSAEAFRTISEAADELGVAQHVLRFWESKFTFIKPMKRAGGRRFYRPADIALLATVRRLLHEEGYTIKGVQKLYRETGFRQISEGADVGAGDSDPDIRPAVRSQDARARLEAALTDLEAAKSRLDKLLGRS